MALMPGVRRKEKPTPRLGVGRLCRGHHRLGVLDRRRQRLLAQHVLAGGEQRFDNRPVQLVGDGHRHDVDVRSVHDRLPGGLRPLVAEALGAVDREGLVRVGDRHQADLGKVQVVQLAGGAVAGSVGSADHASADDGDAEGVLGHGACSFVRRGIRGRHPVSVLRRTHTPRQCQARQESRAL